MVSLLLFLFLSGSGGGGGVAPPSNGVGHSIKQMHQINQNTHVKLLTFVIEYAHQIHWRACVSLRFHDRFVDRMMVFVVAVAAAAAVWT